MANSVNISDITRYESYKDSGVKWLDDLPSHWEIKRIKYLFAEINERSFDGSEDLLSVSQYTGVTNKSERTEDGEMLTNAATLEGYKKVWEGDLVTNIMLAWNGSLGFSPYNGITSPAYSIYRLKTKAVNKYFHYLFRTELYKSEFKRNSSGVIESRLRLYTDDFFRIWSILPPLPEQTAIAEFLDLKTALIDQAIEIKQKQIELLKERRQILIHKAVTRGLNPNVKMKDSGVEWIGEIPEHWEVKRLKDICFINLNSLPENTNSNFEFNYVDIGSVTLESGICNTEEFIFKNAPSRARRIAKTGDTIISTVRTYLKAIDFIDQVKSSNIYSTGFAVLQPKEFICPEFLGYFVRSDAFTEQVSVNSKGMSYPAINSTDIGRLTVVHCETIEQQLIVKHIESNNTKIAKAISLKEHEIEKLKEYKATLINSAVTGKIKVYNDAK
jgi:type I restriction enzyme S subunit